MGGVAAYAQETGGKELHKMEKAKPVKINTKKVRTSKRTKARGNPNKSNQKVESSNPVKWDWGKIMWFKARKSDYKTKDYNPNKRTKRKTYSNDKPRYKSEHREPGEGNDPLPRPIIPYDTRIDDEGPILIKKRKAKKTDLKNVGPTIDVPVMSINRPEDTLEKRRKKDEPVKIDNKDLMTVKVKDDNRKPFDQSKLEIANRPDYKSNKMDDDKLMTINKSDKKPKPYDQSKLETIRVSDNKPAKMDNDKLMTSVVTKPKKQDLHDDRLLIVVPKIERSKLHDDRLLTVDERTYPSKTMKRISEDIADYEGTYELNTKKGKDYHPSSRHLSAKRHGIPWLAKTQQGLSMFWSKIWPWDLQPSNVTDKKPKLKRDKKEGQIWDNTVHPDSWKNNSEKAESGEEQ